MADLGGFNAEKYEPMGDFTPIPKGKYLAIAVESDWKDTKAGTGQYLQFKFEVVDGEHKGRALWAILNLRNPNDTAVRIANSELSSICRAAGIMRPKDSSELHNKPLTLDVDVEERNDKPGVKTNRIKGYGPPANGSGKAPEQKDKTAPWRS